MAGKKKTTAKHAGRVSVGEKSLKVVYEGREKKEYAVPHGYGAWVKEGDLVSKGDQLTEGNLDLYELHDLRGKEASQRYMINKILHLYFFQGQKLNDKHVEVIARQMFSRVYVKDAKETDLITGGIVTKPVFMEANEKAAKEGKKPAVGDEMLLGITKVSLSTESFLSAASFQETARVLIDAAITEKVDKLRGLKENVIIGRLIPVGTGFKKA